MVIGKQGILVDGFDSETSLNCLSILQMQVARMSLLGNANDKYPRTLNLENQIRSLGHNLVSVWECENPEFSKIRLQQEFFPYPHYTVYNF